MVPSGPMRPVAPGASSSALACSARSRHSRRCRFSHTKPAINNTIQAAEGSSSSRQGHNKKGRRRRPGGRRRPCHGRRSSSLCVRRELARTVAHNHARHDASHVDGRAAPGFSGHVVWEVEERQAAQHCRSGDQRRRHRGGSTGRHRHQQPCRRAQAGDWLAAREGWIARARGPGRPAGQHRQPGSTSSASGRTLQRNAALLGGAEEHLADIAAGGTGVRTTVSVSMDVARCTARGTMVQAPPGPAQPRCCAHNWLVAAPAAVFPVYLSGSVS